MFDVGLQEMLVIGILALLIFGPSKLPELGRMVGRAMRELRRASDEFRTTVETNLHMNDPDGVTAGPLLEEQPQAILDPAPAPPPLTAETGGDGPLETAAEPPVESGEPFVAKRGARLFHRRECSWVGRIPEIDRVYLKRVADARDQGFVECPVCEPWEPG
jgi:Tat protein translocase TatB subunit